MKNVKLQEVIDKQKETELKKWKQLLLFMI